MAEGLKSEVERECGECAFCANTLFKNGEGVVCEILFDTPWSDGYFVEFCGDDCHESFLHESSHDFSYDLCEQCDRLICQRNPMNGYRTHFRFDGDDYQCMGCYQDGLLENGQPEEDFQDSRIGGGDFFSESELRESGFVPDEKFTRFSVKNNFDARVFNSRAKELIQDGIKVIICHNSLSIFGDQGYVTLWKKMDAAADD